MFAIARDFVGSERSSSSSSSIPQHFQLFSEAFAILTSSQCDDSASDNSPTQPSISFCDTSSSVIAARCALFIELLQVICDV
jgi:hypothetical protein